MKKQIKRLIPSNVIPYAAEASSRVRIIIDRISRIPNLARPKIFCISVQRTGTTSVGLFFKKYGFDVAHYAVARRNQWRHLWFNGEYEKIFWSEDFRLHQVFEDTPWWFPRLYRVLFHRFPRSRFVLFTRDADSWFDSMVQNRGGKNLGNAYVHCSIYQREKEFYRKFGNTEHVYSRSNDRLIDIKEKRGHYTDFYRTRNTQVLDFFAYNNPDRLIHCRLEDSAKWQRLGEYFGIDVPDSFDIHANASSTLGD